MFLWKCWFSGDNDWCCYVIAPTRGKAKAMFFDWEKEMIFSWNHDDYVNVRSRKIKPAEGFAAQVCDMQCPELDALGVRYLTQEELDALEEAEE